MSCPWTSTSSYIARPIGKSESLEEDPLPCPDSDLKCNDLVSILKTISGNFVSHYKGYKTFALYKHFRKSEFQKCFADTNKNFRGTSFISV